MGLQTAHERARHPPELLRRLERFVGQMLAQHFAVLIDHVIHEFFVFFHAGHALGNVGVVSRSRKEECHV